MTEHRLGAHPERRVPAATLGPWLTLLARPGISACAVHDQSASPRRRLWRPRVAVVAVVVKMMGQALRAMGRNKMHNKTVQTMFQFRRMSRQPRS